MLYDNCIVLSPDGILLFRCNVKKADWYLERNLATSLGGNPLTIKLTFEPNGVGSNGDKYMLNGLPNICVVCGEEDKAVLTKHHVVPYCYRKHMQRQLGYLNSFDVVVLCRSCHDKYERKATQLKKQIADEVGAPIMNGDTLRQSGMARARSHARALINHLDVMPPHKIEDCINTVKAFLEKENLTDSDIEYVASIEVKATDESTYGTSQFVIEHTKDLNQFAVRWRRHFVETMNPQYLEEGWSVEGRDATGRLYELVR